MVDPLGNLQKKLTQIFFILLVVDIATDFWMASDSGGELVWMHWYMGHFTLSSKLGFL